MWKTEIQKVVEKLAGKKLRAASLNRATDSLCLEFDDGTAQWFTTDAECCSSSWIEHLATPDDIGGAELVGVDEIDIRREDDHPDHDCLRVYETRFRTTRGDIVCEYRNASNGYYGGSLVPAGPATKAGA